MNIAPGKLSVYSLIRFDGIFILQFCFGFGTQKKNGIVLQFSKRAVHLPSPIATWPLGAPPDSLGMIRMPVAEQGRTVRCFCCAPTGGYFGVKFSGGRWEMKPVGLIWFLGRSYVETGFPLRVSGLNIASDGDKKKAGTGVCKNLQKMNRRLTNWQWKTWNRSYDQIALLIYEVEEPHA